MRTGWWIGIALGLAVAAAGVRAQQAPRGLWLLARKDPGNSARADIPGRMATAPREVWSYGGGGDTFSFCQPVSIGGKRRYFGQVRGGLRLVEPGGKPVWSDARFGAGSVLGVADFQGNGAVQAVVTLGQGFALVDVASGRKLWTWAAPAGAYLGSYKLHLRPGDSRLVCFPQNTLQGVCFRLPGKDGLPEKLWERTYTNAYWQGYGPQIVLGDMDNDRQPEVVVAGKPGYAGVLDLDTGALRYDVRYQVTDGPEIGRPYGLLHVEDLDGDGFRDVVVASCQVEEYVAVLRNVGGKGLTHAWSQFVEKDYPEDRVELRPNVTSVADLDGDGKKEVVVGLFHVEGDQKWHTVAFDAFGGWKARRLDLPGRFFWGCYDLDGDGRAEIVTSAESARRTAPGAVLQAVDGRSGRDIALLAGARLETFTGPLAENTGFLAFRATPVFVGGKEGGLLVRRRDGAGPEELWRLKDGKSDFARVKLAAGARSVLLSNPSPTREGLDPRFRGTGGTGGPDATCARVAVVEGRRELVLALSDGRVVGGEPDWKRPGRFRRSWTMPGTLPSLWLGPAGERVVCTVAPSRDAVFLGQPAPAGAAEPVRIRLPFPVYVNENTTSAATLLPFGEETFRLFVGLQTGVHTLACALYDAGGKELWLNPKTGPYPRTAAAARLAPGAPYSLVVNDHYNKTIYGLDGRPRLELPYGSSRNGGMVSSPYTLPIVGPYGPAGETRLFFTPGLDTVQTLDGAGTVLASRSFNTYEFEYCGSSVATLRPGLWDLGMVNHDGVFHCVDLATGLSRWTLDLGAKANFAHNVSTVDLDGDGRDNFLVGLPDGSLVALDEKDGKGAILWRKAFPAGVRDAFAADVEGDGYAELLVETDDGRVRVLRPS